MGQVRTKSIARLFVPLFVQCSIEVGGRVAFGNIEIVYVGPTCLVAASGTISLVPWCCGRIWNNKCSIGPADVMMMMLEFDVSGFGWNEWGFG